MGTYITQGLTAGAALRTQAQTALDQADARLVSIAGGDFYGARTAVTLASDAFTLSAGVGFYVVSSQSGVTDNIATISGGTSGRVIVLTAASGHTLTIVHGSGNIETPNGSNATLTGAVTVTLIWDNTRWLLISAGQAPLVSGVPDYIQLTSALGGAGGTFTSGDWRTRPLTVEAFDTGNHCTLASNQFTLQAGTYTMQALVPGFAVGNHLARLQNITDGVRQIAGVPAVSPAGTQTYSDLRGRFVIAGTKTFEIQHRCDTTVSTNGMGIDLSAWDANHVHLRVELWRLAN